MELVLKVSLSLNNIIILLLFRGRWMKIRKEREASNSDPKDKHIYVNGDKEETAREGIISHKLQKFKFKQKHYLSIA